MIVSVYDGGRFDGVIEDGVEISPRSNRGDYGVMI